jgi:hypothetical protein
MPLWAQCVVGLLSSRCTFGKFEDNVCQPEFVDTNVDMDDAPVPSTSLVDIR